MKDWPDDPAKIADFSDLIEPLLKSLHAGANVTPRRGMIGRDIPYDGYTTGLQTRATFPDPERALRAEFREHSGMSLAEVIVTLAIQLGIEQGRRLAHDEIERHADAAVVKWLRGWGADAALFARAHAAHDAIEHVCPPKGCMVYQRAVREELGRLETKKP